MAEKIEKLDPATPPTLEQLAQFPFFATWAKGQKRFHNYEGNKGRRPGWKIVGEFLWAVFNQQRDGTPVSASGAAPALDVEAPMDTDELPEFAEAIRLLARLHEFDRPEYEAILRLLRAAEPRLRARKEHIRKGQLIRFRAKNQEG